MVTIHLDNLLFRSHHGIHEEETITGSDYLVDIKIKYPGPEEVISKISDTVNYVSLYDIVKNAMQKPTPLLETLCMALAEQFLSRFLLIQEVEISIKKLQAPILNFQGVVGVSYLKKRT